MKDNLRQKNEERHLAQARLPVVIEEAWTRLAHGQFVDNSRLRQEIALSWERCLANKVSPINSKNDTVDNDLLDKTKITRHLLTVAAPSMEQLYQSVRGKGYIVMLSGADGTILHVVGDRKMYSTAETLAVVPGASCSEAVIGTTSPGICLVQKMPVQVFKLEHYCQLYHEWCCSAAPILDDQGNLIGTLDMSNLDPNLHPPYLLDLVKMTAKTIEAELSYRLLRDDFNKSYHYFNLVVNNLPEALIFFDKNDKIAHVNRNAVKILGQPAQHYIGATAGPWRPITTRSRRSFPGASTGPNCSSSPSPASSRSRPTSRRSRANTSNPSASSAPSRSSTRSRWTRTPPTTPSPTTSSAAHASTASCKAPNGSPPPTSTS